jgi:alpha-1,2-mannosyltransferase
VDRVVVDNASPREPNYMAQTTEWKVVTEHQFLNSAKSHPFFRAFYIPWLSAEYTSYDPYVLLQRRHKKSPKPKRQGKEFYDDDI